MLCLRRACRAASWTVLAGAALASLSACGGDEETANGTPPCVGPACTPPAGSDSGSPNDSLADGGNLHEGPTPLGPTGLPCDVEDIVYRHCSSCHSDPPVGTYMPLLTQAHFQAQGTTDPTKKYFELANGRVNSSDDPMPPRDKPQLTSAERDVLNAWFAKGAPQGTEDCGAPPDAGAPPSDGRDVETEELTCYQMLAHAPGDKTKKFKVGTVADGYFNMAFNAPWEGTAYAVVIKPIIDNGPVLHHWLLYRDPLAGPDGSVIQSGGQHTTGELIHAWAPGGPAIDTRPHGDVAFELPATTYLVEFHYNSADPNAEDASGVEICVQKKKPQYLAGLSWLGYDNGIESYSAGQVLGTWASGACLTPSAQWTGTCRPAGPGSDQPVHIIFAAPHMHKDGRHMKVVINGPKGQRVIHDADFDFSSQIGYTLDEVLMPGETITTTCNYSRPTCAGQATSAEMCYFFTYSYPKGALVDLGPWGRTAHGDNTCLGQ